MPPAAYSFCLSRKNRKKETHRGRDFLQSRPSPYVPPPSEASGQVLSLFCLHRSKTCSRFSNGQLPIAKQCQSARGWRGSDKSVPARGRIISAPTKSIEGACRERIHPLRVQEVPICTVPPARVLRIATPVHKLAWQSASFGTDQMTALDLGSVCNPQAGYLQNTPLFVEITEIFCMKPPSFCRFSGLLYCPAVINCMISHSITRRIIL